MLRPCAVQRCPGYFAHLVSECRSAARSFHFPLTRRRNWDLATPTQAVAVLQALSLSRVRVDGLAHVAAPSLSAVIPALSEKERDFVRSACAAMGIDTQSGQLTGDAIVQWLYSSSLRRKLHTEPPAVFPDDFFATLNVYSCLMLLELTLSISIERPVVAVTAQQVNMAVLPRLRALLARETGDDCSLDFATVLWILEMIRGDPQKFRSTITPVAGEQLFRITIRCLHTMLPRATPEECFIAFSSTERSRYKTPFVVQSELHRRIGTFTYEDVKASTTPVLLQALVCLDNPQIAGTCVQVLYENDRISSLNGADTALLIRLMTNRFRCNEDELGIDGFFESLFAQMYLTRAALNTDTCLEVLECLETLSCRDDIPIPRDLREALKQHWFQSVESALKKVELKTCDNVADVLQAIYRTTVRFQRLLERCTLFPRIKSDATQIQHFFCFSDQLWKDLMARRNTLIPPTRGQSPVVDHTQVSSK